MVNKSWKSGVEAMAASVRRPLVRMSTALSFAFFASRYSVRAHDQIVSCTSAGVQTSPVSIVSAFAADRAFALIAI